jgi:hypothetical protein
MPQEAAGIRQPAEILDRHQTVVQTSVVPTNVIRCQKNVVSPRKTFTAQEKGTRVHDSSALFGILDLGFC